MPAFYADLGVADTLDGRFDLLVLHVHLVLRRLSSAGIDGAGELAQGVFDAFFHDMDRTLRAMGVGDMSVGARVKDMVRAYYGRCAAYEAALNGTGDDTLDAAIARNIYAGADTGEGPKALANYVRNAETTLAGQPIDQLMKGQVRFPPIGDPR